MFEQVNSQILNLSKQFAASVIKANTLAVDHFEQIVDVQLKGFEQNLNAVAQFVETAAVVKSPEEFRALAPKSVGFIKEAAEKNVALSQALSAITTRTTESLVALAKGQFDVANEQFVHSAKVAAKK